MDLGEKAFVFQAGDTVAIHVRDGIPSQLTQVDEADKFLTRYFGMGPNSKIDTNEIELEECDRILIASDQQFPDMLWKGTASALAP